MGGLPRHVRGVTGGGEDGRLLPRTLAHEADAPGLTRDGLRNGLLARSKQVAHRPNPTPCSTSFAPFPARDAPAR